MRDEDNVFELLDSWGLGELFAWVGKTSFERVNADYDEPAGHDQAIVGSLAYKYLTNNFDRVTSSEKFALPIDGTNNLGRDVLTEGISPEAFTSMPILNPNLVNRSNYNGSPGWALGDTRWLLQSYTYGEIDKIKWSSKSPTKQKIARQHDPNDPNALFEYGAYIAEDVLQDDPNFSGQTFILAHAFDRSTGSFELYLGRSRESLESDVGPWYWRRRLVSGGPDAYLDGLTTPGPAFPGQPASTDAADLIVPLRVNKKKHETKQNN